ncbi:hypothetical protein HHI36_016815, partial [Cryptolaemus montrouzieri]
IKEIIQDVIVLNRLSVGSDHRMVRAKVLLNIKKREKNAHKDEENRIDIGTEQGRLPKDYSRKSGEHRLNQSRSPQRRYKEVSTGGTDKILF